MTAVRQRAVGSKIAAKRQALRTTALAALVMLLIEYALGAWTNLYENLPASDHGKATFAAFGGAVAHGPAALSIHALLGTLLIVTAVYVVIRAALIGQVASFVLGCIALLAILGAWFSGSKFVSDQANGSSFGMAVAAGVAMLAYVIILFIVTPAAKTRA